MLKHAWKQWGFKCNYTGKLGVWLSSCRGCGVGGRGLKQAQERFNSPKTLLSSCISFPLKEKKFWGWALTFLPCSWNDFLSNDFIEISEIKLKRKKKKKDHCFCSCGSCWQWNEWKKPCQFWGRFWSCPGISDIHRLNFQKGNSMPILTDLPENLLQLWLVQVCSLVTHCRASCSADNLSFLFLFFFSKEDLNIASGGKQHGWAEASSVHWSSPVTLTFTAWGDNLMLWKC